MRTSSLLKPVAICLSGALVAGLTFFTNGKKYFPRQENPNTLTANFAGAAEYYHWLKQDPATGKLNFEAMAAFQQEMAARFNGTAKIGSTTALGLSWNEMGPDNIGGRCRAVLVDKKNTSRMFAGGVSAGLFRSDNGGNTWSPVNDQLSSLIVSCITQDGDGNIYFGTGEGMARGGSGDGNSAFIGAGLFKMTYDAGTDSYSSPTAITSTIPTPNNATVASWIYINRLGTSPVKYQHTDGNFYHWIYAAIGKGMWISKDGGTTWTNAITAMNNKFCFDVDVCNDGAVYCSIGTLYGGSNKIYYSSAANHGDVGTFVDITPASSATMPSGSYGRIEIAASRTNSNIIYASVAKPYNTGAATCLGIIQSIDAGLTWSVIGLGTATFEPFATYGQGDYDHVLEVFPDDNYKILLGGVDLYSWTGVGQSQPNVGQWDQVAFQGGFPTYPKYVHADKHAITFHPTNPNTFYIGCDGGVFRSTDRGNSFTALNKGFNATQFYAIAFERDALWSFGPNKGQYNGAGVLGGTQDNGSPYISGNLNTVMSGESIHGGDGFGTEASMLSPNTFFTTSYYGLLERTANRDANGAEFWPADRTNMICNSTAGPGSGSFAAFNTPIAIHENPNLPSGVDSVDFIIDSIRIPNIKIANGDSLTYRFTVIKPQVSAHVNAQSIKITAGNQVLVWTGTSAGIDQLAGAGGSTGTYNSATDEVVVNFGTAPAENTPIKIVTAIFYNIGDVVNVGSASFNTKFPFTLTTAAITGDTLRVMDPVQSRLAIGLVDAVYICKNPLNFSAVPVWVKVAGANSLKDDGSTGAFSGMVQSLKFGSMDVLYVATTNGGIWRVKGLSSVMRGRDGDIDSVIVGSDGKDSLWTCNRNWESPIRCERIGGFSSRSITSIAVDPTNANRIVVTLGNYGYTDHVYYCDDATTAPSSSNTSNFTALSTFNAPVYSASFVQTSHGQANPTKVLIGTEAGIYSNDVSTPSTWASEGTNSSGLFPNVPTFTLRQQTLGNWECYNSGIIYAGTHGRGIWQCKDYYSPLVIGMPDHQSGVTASTSKAVKVFPNPANDYTTVNFGLTEDKAITINVYDLKGAKIKTVNCGKLSKGVQNISIELEGLAKGTYIVAVGDSKDVLGTCRFIKATE